MPYLTIIVPQISADSKDEFVSHWPQVAAAMKAVPQVLGLSAGPIIAADGAAVTDFQFLQMLAFATLDDQKAFYESNFVKSNAARYEAQATGPAIIATFEVPEFPKEQKPKDFTQISRISMSDESKRGEISQTWQALAAELGQQTWGGVSVDDGEKVGLAMLGWDSLEDAGKAFSDPKAGALMQKWASLGLAKSVMVKMQVY